MCCSKIKHTQPNKKDWNDEAVRNRQVGHNQRPGFTFQSAHLLKKVKLYIYIYTHYLLFNSLFIVLNILHKSYSYMQTKQCCSVKRVSSDIHKNNYSIKGAGFKCVVQASSYFILFFLNETH